MDPALYQGVECAVLAGTAGDFRGYECHLHFSGTWRVVRAPYRTLRHADGQSIQCNNALTQPDYG